MKQDPVITRQEFEAIIKEVNDAKCVSVYAVKNDCDLFYNAKPVCVKEGLDVDKHRWYETSVSVYAIGEWFLGIAGVSGLFSEPMTFSDCDVETIAYEMEAVQSVTYVPTKTPTEIEP